MHELSKRDPEAYDQEMRRLDAIDQQREKKVQMSKLNRSRTAKGLFCGGDGDCDLKILPFYAQLPAKEQMKVSCSTYKSIR